MFESIPAAPKDPILGLLDIFYADKRSNKINLGIGIYKDKTGNTPVLASVKKAELFLLKNEISKNYLSVDGIQAFIVGIHRLLFGDKSTIITSSRARSAQTPGGTCALRVAADFLVRNTTARCIWLSKPSWPNHKNIFTAAGLTVCDYFYYNNATNMLDFTAMISSLSKVQYGDIVLFHGCCHNPTGSDLTEQQWRELAALSASRGWLPLFDFAYQGFANSIAKDAMGLRIFCETHQELIVCSSFSKNFSLYNERVGACTLIFSNREVADRAFSQLKYIIRANYSNPPSHGAAIVATILTDSVLFSMWKQELHCMRKRIQCMRRLFVSTLLDKGAEQDFSFITQQNGMFSLINLTKEQISALRDKAGVYILNSGRINIAGITMNNIVPLCEAIISVLSITKYPPKTRFLYVKT